MFSPNKSRRLPRLSRSSASSSSSSLLVFCFRNSQKILKGFLVLVVSSNVLLFFLGASTIEQANSNLGRNQYIPGWTSDLESAQENLTCEAWLRREDEVTERRLFSEEPVRIHAAEDREYTGCAVGCTFVKEIRDGDCDADVLDSDPNCAFSVIVQETDEDQSDVQRNRSSSVLMGVSLDTDVPIGQPSWTDYPLMAPPGPKTARSPIVALLNTMCEEPTRMEVIEAFRLAQVSVDLFGKCMHNRSAFTRAQQDVVSKYKFALVFEDSAGVGHMSSDYWVSLSAGTVPIIVSPTPKLHFLPADNSYLHVKRMEDIRKVADWVGYLVRFNEAYAEMLKWKDDWPSDAFLALMDMAVVRSECRLCIHIATRLLEAKESEQGMRPCRCLENGVAGEGPAGGTLYHLFIRERGRFKFHQFFLRSSELTMTALVKAVFHLFKSLDHKPMWSRHRPAALSGAVFLLRAFRIYPAGASQAMALQGHAAFHNDEQFQNFIQATPCPKLEVIFL